MTHTATATGRTTTDPAAFDAVDVSFGPTSQGYRFTRVHRIAGHTVRIRIHRDSYVGQSHAVAAVLTPDMTWTDLVDEPPHAWHTGSPLWRAGMADERHEQAALEFVTALADSLVHRVAAVLGAGA